MTTGTGVFDPQINEADIDFRSAFEQMPGYSALLAVDAPYFSSSCTKYGWKTIFR